MWTKKTSFLHKVTLEGLRQEDLLVQVFAPNDAMVLLDLVHGQELQSANGKENQLALGDFTSSEDLVVVAHRKLWIPKQKLNKGVQKCQNKGTLCTPNVLTTLTSQVAQNASQTVHIELCTSEAPLLKSVMHWATASPPRPGPQAGAHLSSLLSNL